MKIAGNRNYCTMLFENIGRGISIIQEHKIIIRSTSNINWNKEIIKTNALSTPLPWFNQVGNRSFRVFLFQFFLFFPSPLVLLCQHISSSKNLSPLLHGFATLFHFLSSQSLLSFCICLLISDCFISKTTKLRIPFIIEYPVPSWWRLLFRCISRPPSYWGRYFWW